MSVVGALVLAGGLLSACGGSSSPKSSASANNGSSSSTTAKATTSLTIALPVAEPVQSPVYLAAKLGYFKKAGINAKIIVLSSDTADNAALVSGSVKYTSVNAVSLLHANESGVPLQFICTEYDGPEFALAVNQSTVNSDHLTKGMPAKQLFQALHGVKVAIVGTAASAPGLMLTGLLKQEGFPANWFTIVGVSASSDLSSAFSHGEVSAVFDSQPTPDKLVQQTPGKVVFDTTQLSGLAAVPWEGILGDRSYISSHPTVDKEVCQAIGQADNYLRSNPSEAVSQLQSTFPSLSATLLKDSLTSYKWANDATMTSSQWTKAASLLSSFGLVKAPSSSVLKNAYSTAYLP